jgi:hypothetical protein
MSSRPWSWAMPTRKEVIDFVAEKISWSVPASVPFQYCSWTSTPSWTTATQFESFAS